jgi:hypothetical protein
MHSQQQNLGLGKIKAGVGCALILEQLPELYSAAKMSCIKHHYFDFVKGNRKMG